jgi:hypothetical protein
VAYAANPEKARARVLCWQAANSEKKRARQRRWRAVNLEKVRAAARFRYNTRKRDIAMGYEMAFMSELLGPAGSLV